MRVRRDIQLAGDELIVETTYEKLAGAAVRAAVWTITQLTSPERIFLLLPERSSFAAGHRSVGQAPPSDVSVDGRLLSLARDREHKTMLVSDAEALAWIGPGCALLLRTRVPPPAAGAAWPDGAHAQVYTSPDSDQPYVELELLGTVARSGAWPARGAAGALSVVPARRGQSAGRGAHGSWPSH